MTADSALAHPFLAAFYTEGTYIQIYIHIKTYRYIYEYINIYAYIVRI
jgi:hypothetical protein